MEQKEQIKLFTKKHPTWQKVFLEWADFDSGLDVDRIHESFEIMIKNKKILGSIVTIENVTGIKDYFMSNMQTMKDINLDICEMLYDYVTENLHEAQKKNFIKSLKTKKYEYLFTQEIEDEVNTILDNKISQYALKKQFFNKIARFKDSTHLYQSLREFKLKNSGWSKEEYLFKIKEQNLNITIVDYQEVNTLLIEVHDYEACAALGSQAWCIVESENYFKDYTSGFHRQFIYCDFDRTIEDNESLIGFTVDIEGEITSSYLKDDDDTDVSILSEFKFVKMDDKLVKVYLDKLNYNEAFLYICEFGFIKFYDEYVNKYNIDFTFEGHEAFVVAASNGHEDIVAKLLNVPEVKKMGPIGEALREAQFHEQQGVIDLILADPDIDSCTLQHINFMSAVKGNHERNLTKLLKHPDLDPNYNNNWGLRYVSEVGSIYILKILLKDPRINPIWDNNHALRLATKCKRDNVIYTLLDNDRVVSSLTNEWVRKNIIEEYRDICRGYIFNNKRK